MSATGLTEVADKENKDNKVLDTRKKKSYGLVFHIYIVLRENGCIILSMYVAGTFNKCVKRHGFSLFALKDTGLWVEHPDF